MSKISITPNASGTGVFTISSPATNIDRTLTLPDEAGTIITTATPNALTNLDQILHVRDEKPSTTTGGSSVAGNQVRTLNTVVSNTITGASLAANQITLPAGIYTVLATAPTYRSDRHRIRLVNVTDALVLLLGTSEYTTSSEVQTRSIIDGKFTLGASKVLNITHATANAQVTFGLGVDANDTFAEVYTSVFITKIG